MFYIFIQTVICVINFFGMMRGCGMILYFSRFEETNESLKKPYLAKSHSKSLKNET